MMVTNRSVVGLMVGMAFVVSLLASGCTQAPPTAPVKPVVVKTLTVLTPHNEDIQRAFALGFSEWYQEKTNAPVDVRFEWIVRGTPKCVQYVDDLFTRSPDEMPRRSPDILFGGGVMDHQVLADAGWVRPVALDESAGEVPATIAGIPTRDEQGRWYATDLARFGILYNKEVCAARGIAPPTGWSDLADPRFAGWLGIADPSASGTTRQVFMLILQERGWDEGWRMVMGILGNARALTPRSSLALDQVVTGESVAAFAINYDGQKRVNESGGRVQFLVPQGVASVSPGVVCVLKTAKDPALAEAFVRYNLSEAGQKLWGIRAEHGSVNAATLYHYPIVPKTYEAFGAELSVSDNPFKISLGRNVDLAQSRSQLAALEPLLAAATRNGNHLLLQRAWEGVCAGGVSAGTSRELTAPPMTEQDAYALGKRFPSLSPFESMKLLEEWTKRMKERYERIASTVSS